MKMLRRYRMELFVVSILTLVLMVAFLSPSEAHEDHEHETITETAEVLPTEGTQGKAGAKGHQCRHSDHYWGEWYWDYRLHWPNYYTHVWYVRYYKGGPIAYTVSTYCP